MADPKHPRTDEHLDELLDEALDDSLPASDPPSLTQPHDLDDTPEEPLRR